MTLKPVSMWKNELSYVIDIKVKDLKYLGYEEATKELVFGCLLKKVWKKDRQLPLYQVTEDILHLSPHVFMSYVTNLAYQTDDLSGIINVLKSTT